MDDLYERFEKAVSLLNECKEYLQIAHHDAEVKHDSYSSGYYMEIGQFEIMEETERLMSEIDAVVLDFKSLKSYINLY